MRSLLVALISAATLLLSPVAPTSAEPMTEFSSQQFRIGPDGVQFRAGGGRGVDCEELRAACANKDRLGERGEGNCRRFRENCQARPSRQQVCAELRAACLNKERLGEQGEGNCRRYRQTCRGG